MDGRSPLSVRDAAAEAHGVVANSVRVVALIGARQRDQLTDAARAVALELTAADLARIEHAVPPEAAAGARYGAAQMSALDTERGAVSGGRRTS